MASSLSYDVRRGRVRRALYAARTRCRCNADAEGGPAAETRGAGSEHRSHRPRADGSQATCRNGVAETAGTLRVRTEPMAGVSSARCPCESHHFQRDARSAHLRECGDGTQDRQRPEA